MIHRILVLLLVLLCSFSVRGENVDDMGDLPLGKGWFAGAQIGTQYYFSDFKFRRYADVGYGFSANWEAFVGKWLTSVMAMRGSLAFNNVTTGEVHDEPPSLDLKVVTGAFRMVNAEMDLLVDIRRLCRGEQGVYAVRPFMGLGYAWNTNQGEHGATLTLGVVNSWRIMERLDVNVEAKFRLLEDNINGYADKQDAQFVLNAGLSYAF